MPAAMDQLGDVGRYIREQRRQAELSLRKLASQAGVSNPYLSQIERGLRQPSAKILKDSAGRIKGKTPGQVKEILNEAIRAELKAPKTEAGKIFSEALTKQLGVEAKDLEGAVAAQQPLVGDGNARVRNRGDLTIE